MAKSKEKTRQQVEAMQDKAVRFLRDVVGNDDKADDIEDMSVEDYAAKKHVTITNPRGRNPHGKCKKYPDRCVPKKSFAYAPGMDVSKWKLRLDDATHVRDAMARFSHTQGIPRSLRRRVAEEIVRAGNHFGIDSSGFQKKYLGRKTSRRRNPRLTEADRAAIERGARILQTQGYDAFLKFLGKNLGAAEAKRKTRNPGRRQLTVPEKHQLKIAKQTLKMPDAMVGVMGGPTKQQAAEIIRRLTKRNPDTSLDHAAELFEEFHGRPPRKVIEMQEDEERRGTYTALGELWELHFKAPNRNMVKLGFEGNHVKLASSPDGNQLYLIGGDQVMPDNLLRDFGAEGEKDFVALGEATSIVYVTRKAFDGFKQAAYVHKFGEEGGFRPEGFYDRLNHRIILAGGSYHIEAPGIIN